MRRVKARKVIGVLALAICAGLGFGPLQNRGPQEGLLPTAQPSAASEGAPQTPVENAQGVSAQSASQPAFAAVRGNTPPALAQATMTGHAVPGRPIQVVMTLDLRDHAGVDALIAAQQDSNSPLY